MSRPGDARHVVKLEDRVYHWVRALAKAEHRSVANMVNVLLAEAVGARSR